MEPIILASGSARRHEYFKMLRLPFSIMVANVSEENSGGLEPKALAEDLAKRKINAIASLFSNRMPDWICAADTLIALENEAVGKSKNREEARRTLTRLAGRDHEVISALALFNGKKRLIDCRVNVSVVRFAALSGAEIEWYLDTGEWQGVAGAYKIQGLAACFIEQMSGSYSAVVGLPLRELYQMLADNGYQYS